MKTGFRKKTLHASRLAFLAVTGIVFLIPLFWMLSTSLKPDDEIMTVPVKWIPSVVRWDNYFRTTQAFPFLLYLWNTSWLSVVRVAGTLLTAALGAYSFSKLHWKGRDAAFFITIGTMFIPSQVLIVPTYLLFSKLGWINTYLPLVAPAFLGGGAFSIFLLRQFFVSVPNELIDSGRIDGANEFLLFFRIILPMSVPALMTLGLFTFIFAWNDFMGPLIYLLDAAKWTLPIGLRAFQQKSDTYWNLLMAASTLTSLPLLFMYFFGQKYIIRGFSMQEGIK